MIDDFVAALRAVFFVEIGMWRRKITPEQFEMCVLRWISSNLPVYTDAPEVSHLGIVKGFGGKYKIDVLVKTKILGGMNITILAECKHLRRPVERDEVQVLFAKLYDVGAHKGAVFSTSGFQDGALAFARAHGIAAVMVHEGQTSTLTKLREESSSLESSSPEAQWPEPVFDVVVESMGPTEDGSVAIEPFPWGE